MDYLGSLMAACSQVTPAEFVGRSLTEQVWILFISFFNVNQSATGLQSFKNTCAVLKTSMDNTLYIVCLLKVIMVNITDRQ